MKSKNFKSGDVVVCVGKTSNFGSVEELNFICKEHTNNQHGK